MRTARGCPDVVRASAQENHLGDFVTSYKTTRAGRLAVVAGVVLAGGGIGVAVYVGFGTERVLDVVLIVLLAPVALLLFVVLGVLGMPAGRARMGPLTEWRRALRGALRPTAVYAAVATLGVPALANEESAYADAFALLVCLSLAVPGLLLLTMTPASDFRRYVFEHGLLDLPPPDSTSAGIPRVFRWDDVKVYEFRTIGDMKPIRLVNTDGAEVRLLADKKVKAQVIAPILDAQGPGAMRPENPPRSGRA